MQRKVCVCCVFVCVRYMIFKHRLCIFITMNVCLHISGILLTECVCVCVFLPQWKKAEEKLEKELLEAEASDNKDKKIKLVGCTAYC